jgi:hypothetical protein
MNATKDAMRKLLSGGDRRSLAGSERVRAVVRGGPERVAELAALAKDGDWLVTMRAMDLLEKVAHDLACSPTAAASSGCGPRRSRR